MKRKKLYITVAIFILAATAIYTTMRFNTTPTEKEEEQSVFTNAIQLDENSFTNINTKEMKVVAKKPTTEHETRISHGDIIEAKDLSLLSRMTTEDQNESDKKETEDDAITIMSISEKNCDTEKIAICIADSYLNIREENNTESEILGKLYKNSAAHILETKDDWYYIESGNVKGYVKAEYVKCGLEKEELNTYGTLTATVKCDGLNVREKEDTESNRVDVIYNAEKYPVLSQSKEWVKLNLEDDNITGYVKSEYVDVEYSFTEAISIEEERAIQKAEEEAKLKKELAKNSSTIKTTKSEATSHTADELKLLACLVQAEAGNQSYEGRLAVANVVLNRIRSPKYANTMSGVIYQRGQFSVASSGSLKKQLNNYSNFKSKSQKLSIQAAKDALNGINNIGKRLYFNRYSKRVAKKHSGKGGVKIDDQFFW